LFKDDDLVITHPIPITYKRGKVDEDRVFHYECLPLYLKDFNNEPARKIEGNFRDMACRLLKDDILKWKRSFNKTEISAIDGIYTGQPYARGKNRRGTPMAGYSYETLYRCLEGFKEQFITYLVTNQFTDESHKFNAVLFIVRKVIHDVQVDLDDKAETQRILSATPAPQVGANHSVESWQEMKQRQESQEQEEAKDYDLGLF
jgi:hypothetical protein